ncbi:MAG: cytochrome c [Thermomicrobiales bacterium]
MATRLTGLTRGRGLGRPVAAVRSWPLWKQAALGAVFLLAVLAACSSTNTYPIDVYSAMHYQKSYRTLEPPRFGAPQGAVPVQGRVPLYNSQELGQLENPIPRTEESVAIGEQVFNVNCVVCHGEAGQGDGPMAPQLETYGGNPPANLARQELHGVADNYFYSVVTNGLGQWMPAFGDLIPGEQRWHLINYIRATLQGQGLEQ